MRRYRAFLNTLLHEDPTLSGVVVKDSNGAFVRWGVNQADWRCYHIPTLPLEDAIHFVYPSYFPRGLDEIDSQVIVNAVYDVEFNAGREHGVKCLQRAAGVSPDGVIGPLTLAAVRADLTGVQAKLQKTIEDFYRALAVRLPDDAKYLETWLARVHSNFAAEG